jgi:hypothetical protein
MVLNTKQKYLCRSRLSLIFGSWLKLEKLCFLTKTAICSSGKVVKEIFQLPSFYDFYFFLSVQNIAAVSSMLAGYEPSNIIFQKS